MFKKSKSMHEVYSCPFPPKLPEGGQDMPTDDALLEERLSKLAYAFAPDFIVCEDCVFVADFYITMAEQPLTQSRRRSDS